MQNQCTRGGKWLCKTHRRPLSRCDDAETLTAKYAAIKAAGVRGVGMWTADCAGNNASDAAALWGSIPKPVVRTLPAWDVSD